MSNAVEIVGVIVNEARFNNAAGSCQFYRTEIAVKRRSGTEDVLPIIIPEWLMSEVIVGETVYLRGSFRSFNDKESGKVELFIFAEEIVPVNVDHMNVIHLEGFICKKPMLRQTPQGRTICDLLIATHRTCGQSDYIPCVLWERNARLGAKLEIGQMVRLDGRIQSRIYKKRFSDYTEDRVAYEVSVSHLNSD